MLKDEDTKRGAMILTITRNSLKRIIFVKNFHMVTTIKKGTPKSKIQKLLKQSISKKRRVDLNKYLGVIKLKKDPLALQKEWRDEWE